MKRKLATIFKEKASDEKGAILILALIMLAIGVIMLIPLVDFMGSSYKSTSQVYDQQAYELYAADAGVKEAILKIKERDFSPGVINNLNSKEVNYSITSINPAQFGGAEVYRIISEAGNTSITAHAVIIDFFKTFTRNAVTSRGLLELPNNGNKPKANISGPIQVTGINGEYTGTSGFISRILFLDGGNDYVSPEINITGTGSHAEATPIIEDGVITSITLVDGGDAYSNRTKVMFDDSTGSGASASVTVDSNGKITAIKLRDGGAGYTNFPDITFSDPYGSGEGATATVTSVEDGVITSAIMNAGGEGYSAPIISFVDATGKNAAATAVVTGGVISSIILTEGGFGYTSPTVQISGNGGAIATADVEDGVITDISVTYGGSGYTAPIVNIAESIGGSGATATANLTATSLKNVVLNSGGSGYTSAPTVTITGGGGTGATAAANMTNLLLSGFNIISPGSGYISAPTVNITGGGGTGAAATTTITGRVVSIQVTNGGSKYNINNPPTVTISPPGGGGTTATATATVEAIGTGNNKVNKITSITVTNPGSGYSSAPAVIIDPPTSGGILATATAIVSNYVSAIILQSAGSGYTSVPTVEINGGGGSGATVTAIITSSVSSITLNLGGSGYTSVPVVVFNGGGGSGAAATAILSPTSISSITPNAQGSGYSSSTQVIVSGGGGSGATATATVTGGKITGVTINNHGTGYTSTPTVSFSGGGGTGAIAVATVMNTYQIADPVVNVWPPVDENNPEANIVQNWYYNQAQGLPHISGGDINLHDITGPVFIEGDVVLTGNNASDEVTLPDTTDPRIIYVDGMLKLDKCYLNLNSYTIFSASFEPKYAIKSWANKIEGPGCLLANGGIDFQPTQSNQAYIYVMSLGGSVQMQPNGDFVGSIAGSVDVDMQPGNEIIWADPMGLELNLPGSEEHNLLFAGLADWIIK